MDDPARGPVAMVTVCFPTRTSTAAAVFLAWAVTSFLCQQSSQMFLHATQPELDTPGDQTETEHRPLRRICLAFILTVMQCFECLLLVKRRTGRGVTYRRTMTLMMWSHFFATLSNNFSMVFIEASSTQAVKLLEPIAMAVAHHVTFQQEIPLQTVVSMPFIICGALIFSGHGVNPKLGFVGISLALASNIILAARNVTLKKLQHHSSVTTGIVAKSWRVIAYTLLGQAGVVVAVYFLELQDLVPGNCTFATGLCLTSALFHVVYSYISTNIVLNVMDVISHSVANIFKRLLVIACLCLLGSRHITGTHVMGLVLAASGLMSYTQGNMMPGEQHLTGRTDNKTNGQKPHRYRTLSTLYVMISVSIITIGFLWCFAKLDIITPAVRDLRHSTFRNIHGNCPDEAPTNDFSHLYTNERDDNLRDFLSWRLTDHPEDTDKRAKTLTSSREVIEEAQRILLNLLQDLLGKAKHVMLIDIATYDNKGDPAITVGQVMLLGRLNISIVYYCETYSCGIGASLKKAADVNMKYSQDELVILMQGGGNLVGYVYVDGIRKHYVERFPERKIIILSQSIFLHSKNQRNLEYCRNLYSNRSNIVMLLRDRQSYAIAKANFPGVQVILAPDMAFGIGMVPRQLPPIYDIIWLKRNDLESPRRYIIPPIPPNISVEVSDWLYWRANKPKNDLEKTFLIASAGFQFLQRGRIVVTDRLHGHILSTLMNIPHVLIDNPPHLKLSSFHRSWTASLGNAKLVSNGSLAFDAAVELLTKFRSILPSIGPKDMYAPSNG